MTAESRPPDTAMLASAKPLEFSSSAMKRFR